MSRHADEQDARLIEEAMNVLADDREARAMPDPAFIWWKAQLLRRFDAEQEALAPIDVGDRIHFGVAVAGAALLAVLAWSQLPPAVMGPAALIAVAAAVAALIVAVALTAWNEFASR